MCERIVRTLIDHNHPYYFEHVCYQGAGHVFRPPYLPSNKEQMRDKMMFGGSPESSVKACVESWEKLLAFLMDNLKK